MKTITNITCPAFALFAFACFAFLPGAQGQLSPPPDGCYPNFNTAEGCDALNSVTGSGNTGLGWRALFSDLTANFNTGVGGGALALNNGDSNTAVGAGAMLLNTSGTDNVAIGTNALVFNDSGSGNTVTGSFALGSNTTGGANTANGQTSLLDNTTGMNNTAVGIAALEHNTTGSGNIALGALAGLNQTTGSNNICIFDSGVAGESNTIRIGTVGTQNATYIAGINGATVPTGVAVIVDSNGHLGTSTSSARYKENIQPMDKASEAILALKPVIFRYKKELDPDGIPQFGLVAEDVEKVNPALVARDEQGKPYTVRYEAVNAMLLNEFLKEHRKVQEQEATLAELKSAATKQEANAAHQRKQIEVLTAGLQKVSAQLEASKPLLQTIANNQ